MACGFPFIAVFVVARHTSHQLLRFDSSVGFNFDHEIFRVSTSQG